MTKIALRSRGKENRFANDILIFFRSLQTYIALQQIILALNMAVLILSIIYPGVNPALRTARDLSKNCPVQIHLLRNEM